MVLYKYELLVGRWRSLSICGYGEGWRESAGQNAGEVKRYYKWWNKIIR